MGSGGAVGRGSTTVYQTTHVKQESNHYALTAPDLAYVMSKAENSDKGAVAYDALRVGARYG